PAPLPSPVWLIECVDGYTACPGLNWAESVARITMPMHSSLANHLVIENGRRSLSRFCHVLQDLRQVQADSLGSFTVGGEKYSLPRFTFQGPNSSDPIRIGLFAAIHGDEPAGALAAVRFLLDLVHDPQLAENF